MAQIIITFPFGPEETVYIVWGNLIQEGRVTFLNSTVIGPALEPIIENKVKVQLLTDPNRIIVKPLDEVFLSVDDAAAWLELSAVPPPSEIA